MRSRRIWVLALLLIGGSQCPVAGLGLRAIVGVEYDDNPFEVSGKRRQSWGNRFYLHASERLVHAAWGEVQLQHQVGFKRFWKGEGEADQYGDVLANQLELAGLVKLHQRLRFNWSSALKVKDVRRLTSEDSYLRGAWHLGLTGHLGKGWAGLMQYSRSSDDGRERQIADISFHRLGFELVYQPSRQMRGNLGVHWRFLNYDRPALAAALHGLLLPIDEEQADRLRELSAGIQFFRGALVRLNYAFLDNHSNSTGYSFAAHRTQVLLSRHIAAGIDGQLFLTTQLRRYNQEKVETRPLFTSEEDEYEQQMFSLKLSRQLNERYGVSSQYRHSRNGSRQDGDAFRKNVYSLALEFAL